VDFVITLASILMSAGVIYTRYIANIRKCILFNRNSCSIGAICADIERIESDTCSYRTLRLNNAIHRVTGKCMRATMVMERACSAMYFSVVISPGVGCVYVHAGRMVKSRHTLHTLRILQASSAEPNAMQASMFCSTSTGKSASDRDGDNKRRAVSTPGRFVVSRFRFIVCTDITRVGISAHKTSSCIRATG